MDDLKYDGDIDPQELEDMGLEIQSSEEMEGALEDIDDLDPEDEDWDLDDEETEQDTEVEEEEVEEREVIDLTQGSRARSYQADAFEEWMSLAQKHPTLEYEETDRLVKMAHSDDEELASLAEDRLVRHNVLWIMNVLQRMKGVGRRVMGTPGELRNEVLGYARLGFLDAIRHYDEEKAISSGVAGHKKTLLKHSETWIRKYVGEYMKKHRYRMNEDAALALGRVKKADKKLHKKLGHRPSSEQIAEELKKQVRAKLEREGEMDPDERRLRRRGALSVDQIEDLRQAKTTPVSFDAPAPGSDEGEGRTLKEYIAHSGAAADEEEGDRQAMEELMFHVGLETTPTQRDHFLTRDSLGLFNARMDGRAELLNPQELGEMIGRSRDTLNTHLDKALEIKRARKNVDVNDLTAPDQGVFISPNQAAGYIEEMEKMEKKFSKLSGTRRAKAGARKAEIEAELERLRETIRNRVYLPDVLVKSGVKLNPSNPGVEIACPIEESPQANTFKVSSRAWSCEGCGVNRGDLVDWLIMKEGLDLAKALKAATRMALKVDSVVEVDEEDRAEMVTYPARHRRIKGLF